jgi:hypothetical protein
MILSGAAGCSEAHKNCPPPPGCSIETGYCNQGQTQIQFFAPPGALVTVAGKPTRAHEIATYGPYKNRLEQNPEEFSVFNLAPGMYEFKYTSAEGLPGVSVYGELDVKHADSRTAQIFQRRAFIPISLPSEYYRKAEVVGDERFPFRGEAFRTAIDAHDLERLSQGEVIEKVFMIADLQVADDQLKKTNVKISKIEREIEYADARFRYAYLDFRSDVTDPISNFFHTDRNFITWEKKRQRLEQELTELQASQARLQAVLHGDHVLIRKGMLVVSTEQLVTPYRDVEQASEKVGEVLLVMRLGGRHMHWGDPAQEAVVQDR